MDDASYQGVNVIHANREARHPDGGAGGPAKRRSVRLLPKGLRRRCALALGLGFGLLAATPGAAQDPAAGREIAMRLCARCHAVAPGMASPTANAPPFASFGVEWPVSDLQEALAEGILVGHSDPPMPEFVLTPEEISDLIAYLETIAGK